MQSTHRRLRRVWVRALAACALYLLAALVLPRLLRGVGPQGEPPRREEAPEYIMPNGERRRAVVVTRPDAPQPTADRSGDRALLWWSAILAAVTLAGATAQTMRIRADARRAAE